MPDRLVMSSRAQATDVIARAVAAGDHSDGGNWRCPLGLAALSVETLLILLAVWQARSRPTALAVPTRPAVHRITETRIPEESHLG